MVGPVDGLQQLQRHRRGDVYIICVFSKHTATALCYLKHSMSLSSEGVNNIHRGTPGATLNT